MTSFGHLICAARPGRPFDDDRDGDAREERQLGRAALGRRAQQRRDEQRGAGRRLPAAAHSPPPVRLLLRHRNRALGLVGVEHPLRRLGPLGVEIGPAEAAAQQRLGEGGRERGQTRSSRTAETLYSGVPISGSPTSCVSQLTRASAKCSAIQTRPG